MSSKRGPSGSAPASPRKKTKRSKDDGGDGQSSLDAFFRPRTAIDSNASPQHDDDDDAALARRLAAADGLGIDALRRLEQEIARGVPGAADVIDVDLLDDDDDDAAAGPSTTPPRRIISVPSSPTKPTNPFPPAFYPPLTTDPAIPATPCPWPTPGPTPYSFLAHALSTLSATRSRTAILHTLTNCLRTIVQHDPPALCAALYLLSNALAPPYEAVELGLGPAVISRAVQHVSGLSGAALKRLYNSTGDPGDVAYAAKSTIRTLVPHAPLTVVGVYAALLQIAQAKGAGAAKQKQAVVERLLVAAKGEETRFLVRTLAQNLRVGAVRTSILTALARAVVLSEPPPPGDPENEQYYAAPGLVADIEPAGANAKRKAAESTPARDVLNDKYGRAEAAIKKAYVLHPNYEHIAAAVLQVGLAGLAGRLPLTVGIPLLPTLGSPTRSLDEIYERLGSQPFSAEFKYDGQRAQIHATRTTPAGEVRVKIFSRHLEDMTDKYPDVVALVDGQFADVRSFIMDAEIVAVDPADGSLRSFQELSNRARRGVDVRDVKVPVCVFAFDLMYLDDEILLEKPFRQRRSLLRSTFAPYTPDEGAGGGGGARFAHVQSCESEDGREAVEGFWLDAVHGRSEGLMIKLLDSGEVVEEGKSRRKPLPATYEPDKRTSAWLKLKKDYVTGLGDSLDLVPIGAWHGNGRKAQWWSPILLAVWDPDAGKLVAVCKCMSGFSDTFYKELRERYPENSETCAQTPLWDPPIETGGLRPEVYFKPREVWEIRGADVTVSPVSVAAMGLATETRGLSLRFPRFIKIREDKSIENASTPEFLAGMYRSQQGQGKGRGGVDDGDLVDVDVQESEVEEEAEESEPDDD